MKKCKICGREVEKFEYYGDICSDECFHIAFWMDIIKNKDKQIIVNGVCYTPSPDNDKSVFKGFDGREFKIYKFDSDEMIITHNLWYRGEVPEEFKDVLKDNAEFID